MGGLLDSENFPPGASRRAVTEAGWLFRNKIGATVASWGADPPVSASELMEYVEEWATALFNGWAEGVRAAIDAGLPLPPPPDVLPLLEDINTDSVIEPAELEEAAAEITVPPLEGQPTIEDADLYPDVVPVIHPTVVPDTVVSENEIISTERVDPTIPLEPPEEVVISLEPVVRPTPAVVKEKPIEAIHAGMHLQNTMPVGIN